LFNRLLVLVFVVVDDMAAAAVFATVLVTVVAFERGSEIDGVIALLVVVEPPAI
jgi:hypothetical protein